MKLLHVTILGPIGNTDAAFNPRHVICIRLNSTGTGTLLLTNETLVETTNKFADLCHDLEKALRTPVQVTGQIETSVAV